MKKYFRYIFEYLCAFLICGILKLMPTEMASNLGGKLGRKYGPRTGAHRTADKNLKRAMPDLSEEQYATILDDMWDNLGRVVCEYPHLRVLSTIYCEIENVEILQELADSRKGGFLIGMHQANWEVAAMKLREIDGLNVGSVYRAPNNHFVDRFLFSLRDYKKHDKAFAKSKQGVRDMVRHLKNNGHVGLLVDQKYNEGIQADFLGHPAMTSTAYIELAKKFKCPIIPIEMRRVKGCYFKMIIHPPLELDLNKPEKAIAQTHILIERWIKERPAEWLWVHKRWKAENTTVEAENETLNETLSEIDKADTAQKATAPIKAPVSDLIFPDESLKRPLGFYARYNKKQVPMLIDGFNPKDMDDKWRVIMKDDWLYFLRSWSNHVIFALKIDIKPKGNAEVIDSWYNGDNKQYQSDQSSDDQITFLKKLIKSLFGFMA